jgi:AAA+ superfamily predicted ATPase
VTPRCGYPDTITHLADELRRLDLMIRRRLATTTLLNELAPQSQTARTVYISRDEVNWLLSTGAPVVPPVPELDEVLDQLSAAIATRVRDGMAAGAPLALPALGRLLGLSITELRAVVICLAPELRRKYDRVYAYLQDDITRKRPSVDLILDLLCTDEAHRWRALRIFDDNAPLLRLGILRAVPDPGSPSGCTGLARFLALDPRICGFLLGNDELDARLAGRARLDRPGSDSAAPEQAADLARLAVRHGVPADRPGPALVFALHGPEGVGKWELARQVSAELDLALLTVDLRTVGDALGEAPELIRIAVREGRLQRAAICLAGVDEPAHGGVRRLLAAVEAALHDMGGLAFLTGVEPWLGGAALGDVPVHEVQLTLPDVARSAALWRHALADRVADPAPWAAELADRFRLTPAAIRAAAAAADRHRLTEACPRALTLADVYAACREQSAGRLSDLAVAIRPACGWDELVLPADRIEQLRNICAQVRHHHRVFGGWGFAAWGTRGTGLTALFGGPPGTGKTMAAEVLAGDLGLDLYKVDLSGVVSKYVGETEKNLRRVFTEARSGNAILFFDEADALFGKRTEVSDAHDRYANIETSYLLQQMEQYDGVVLLATNLRQNLDDAFTRRMRFIIEFPFPDAHSRARIWRTHFPPAAPIASDVDFDFLAHEFAVAGGTIRNIVLNAAFLAAADGGVIDRRHILHSTRREFEKIGRLWTEPVTAGSP